MTKIIRRAHVTEKATGLTAGGAYTFEVAPGATKGEVRAAIKRDYKVTPTRVNIIKVKPKTIVMRGRVGRRPGLRKAVVFLKAGEKIDFA